MYDEFLIGDELLVAPILNENEYNRDVYLPRGKWRSENGNIYEGPINVKSYPAPIEVIPYFIAV